MLDTAELAKHTDPAPAGVSPRKRRVSGFGRVISDRHKSAVRMLGYALTSNDPQGWKALAYLLTLRLTVSERIGLAFAALRALEPEPRQAAFDLAHWGTSAAGPPEPPGRDAMAEARSWAFCASRRELKAWVLACFEALPPQDRAAFLAHVAGGRP